MVGSWVTLRVSKFARRVGVVLQVKSMQAQVEWEDNGTTGWYDLALLEAIKPIDAESFATDALGPKKSIV